MVLIDMLDRKLLTDIFGASLLSFEFSGFRNIVLPYHLRMLLRVYTRKLQYSVSLVFCSVLKKSTLLNIKLQGRLPIVPSFPKQLLVICMCMCVYVCVCVCVCVCLCVYSITQSKQDFQLDLNFPVIWGSGQLLWGAFKVKVLLRELSEIYLFCYNLFLQFLYRRRDKRLRSCCIYAILWCSSEN